MLFDLLNVVARHDSTLVARLFQLQDSIDMNKLILKREKKFLVAAARLNVVYRVIKVVGSVSPYVGEELSPDYVKDLCDQPGIWQVTFI